MMEIFLPPVKEPEIRRDELTRQTVRGGANLARQMSRSQVGIGGLPDSQARRQWVFRGIRPDCFFVASAKQRCKMETNQNCKP